VPKRYPAEFRSKVLDLVAAGRPVTQVAADLAISEQTIYVWRRQHLIDTGQLPGTTSSENAELVAARRRIVNAETLNLYRELLPELIAVRLTVSFTEASRRARLRPTYLTDEEFEALHRAQADVLAVDHQLDVTDLDRAEQVLHVRTLWKIT
jgi:transposase